MALSYEELIEKASDQSLTVSEVIDYADSRPNVSSSAKKQIRALRSGFGVMGLDLNMPYVDLRKSEILELFNPEFAPDASNRYGSLGSLEKPFQQALEASEMPAEQRALYPALAGAGTEPKNWVSGVHKGQVWWASAQCGVSSQMPSSRKYTTNN